MTNNKTPHLIQEVWVVTQVDDRGFVRGNAFVRLEWVPLGAPHDPHRPVVGHETREPLSTERTQAYVNAGIPVLRRLTPDEAAELNAQLRDVAALDN